MAKPHLIQGTFLSLELNLYSLSHLLHTNNCKAILRTESYFNTAVRQVTAFSQGNGFCFLLNYDKTCMLENRRVVQKYVYQVSYQYISAITGL